LSPSFTGAPVLLRLAAVRLKTYSLFALLAWSLFNATDLVGSGPIAHAAESQEVELAGRQVTRVVDGDTLILRPNDKIRLIGVDTPETVHPKKVGECYGKEAKEFTHTTVSGQKIRLVLDDANAGRRHKDRYGRTLGYVYLQTGTMLNAELIRRGFAHAYTRFPFRYLVEFRRMEQEARSRGMGLWSNCPVS
jgi:micrococcal nuclease